MPRPTKHISISAVVLLWLLAGISFASVYSIKTGDSILTLSSSKGIVATKTDPISGTTLAKTALPSPSGECSNCTLIRSPGYIFALWTCGDLLIMSRSRDNGSTWERPFQAFLFDEPHGPVKALYSNNKLYIFYSSGAAGLRYIFSMTDLSFSSPQNVSQSSYVISDFDVSSFGSNIVAAWGDASSESVFISESSDSGSSWQQPFAVRSCSATPETVLVTTSESGCVLSWTEPSEEKCDLYACSVPDNISGSFYLSLVRTSDMTMDHFSLDSFCSDNFMLSWSEGNSLYTQRSADKGITWKTARRICSWQQGKTPASILVDLSGYYFVSGGSNLSCITNKTPVPAVITPKNIITNRVSPVISVRPATDANGDELVYNIKTSCVSDPTASVSSVYSGGNSFVFSSGLKDGTYVITIEACDGFSVSTSDAATLVIDTVPPGLFMAPIVFPTGESGTCVLSGTVESTSTIKLNGTVLPVFNGAFVSKQNLKTGTNIFTLEASDQAGNLSVVRTNAYFDPYAPQISIIKPGISDWYKPGSAIAFDSAVTDRLNYIEDETQATVLIDGVQIPSSVYYDLSSGKASGFIMPQQMTKGKHILTMVLAGAKGNPGQASCPLNIDTDPPVLNLPVRNGKYSVNTCNRITFRLVDDCSGPDLGKTTIKVSCDNTTVEGQLTFDQNSGDVIFTPSEILKEGLYRVTMSFRDKAGNVANPVPFDLVVDTSPIQAMSSNVLSMSELLPCPNPADLDKGPVSLTYNIANMSSPCRTVLRIFDNCGRLVWKTEVSSKAGLNSVSWYGNSIDGTPLGNGTYIIMAVSSDSSTVAGPLKSRIIILR